MVNVTNSKNAKEGRCGRRVSYTPGSAQMRGFATAVGSKADIGAVALTQRWLMRT